MKLFNLLISILSCDHYIPFQSGTVKNSFIITWVNSITFYKSFSGKCYFLKRNLTGDAFNVKIRDLYKLFDTAIFTPRNLINENSKTKIYSINPKKTKKYMRQTTALYKKYIF